MYLLPLCLTWWLKRRIESGSRKKPDKWGIIQLGSSWLKFYIICLCGVAANISTTLSSFLSWARVNLSLLQKLGLKQWVEGSLFGSKHFLFLNICGLFSIWNPHRIRGSDCALPAPHKQGCLGRSCSPWAFSGKVCWAWSHNSTPQNKTPWSGMAKHSKTNNKKIFFVMYNFMLIGSNYNSDLLPSLLCLPSIWFWRSHDSELSCSHAALLNPV